MAYCNAPDTYRPNLPDSLMFCTLLTGMRQRRRHTASTAPVGLLVLCIVCLFLRTEPFLIQHQRGDQATVHRSWLSKPTWTTSAAGRTGLHLYYAQSKIQTESRTADSSQQASKYLILFKGGASGREDAGDSLTEFRQSEFRAIAAMHGMKDSHQFTFRDALITDLAEAAGLATRGEDGGEDEDDEEGERGDGSSLQWFEGDAAHSLTPEVLRKISSRLVLTHAIYEVSGERTALGTGAGKVRGRQYQRPDRLATLCAATPSSPEP